MSFVSWLLQRQESTQRCLYTLVPPPHRPTHRARREQQRARTLRLSTAAAWSASPSPSRADSPAVVVLSGFDFLSYINHFGLHFSHPKASSSLSLHFPPRFRLSSRRQSCTSVRRSWALLLSDCTFKYAILRLDQT